MKKYFYGASVALDVVTLPSFCFIFLKKLFIGFCDELPYLGRF